MDTNVFLAILVVLLPFSAWLTGFVYAFFNRKLPAFQDKIATAGICGSLAISLYLMLTEVLFAGGGHGITEAATWSWEWIRIGGRFCRAQVRIADGGRWRKESFGTLAAGWPQFPSV